MPPKLTQEKAEKKINDFDSDYILVSQYIAYDKPVTIRHCCGHEYEIGTYKSFLENKCKCPKCFKPVTNKGQTRKPRVTEKEFLKRLKEQVGNEYTYVSGYTKMKKEVTLIHNVCGNEIEVTPKMFLGPKQTRCKFCANKSRGKHLREENYLQRILNEAEDGIDYEWIDTEYHNDNKELYKILHKSCSRDYDVRPNDFQQGYRCPYCFSIQNESIKSTFIKKYFNENSISFEEEKKFDGLKYKANLRFDIFIPKDNILIEFDGEQHFKSSSSGYFIESSFESIKKRDSIKNKWCIENGYSLLRIPYSLSNKNIEILLKRYIEKGKFSTKFLKSHNIYFYESNSDTLINSKTYYINLNEDYFNETEPSLKIS